MRFLHLKDSPVPTIVVNFIIHFLIILIRKLKSYVQCFTCFAILESQANDRSPDMHLAHVRKPWCASMSVRETGSEEEKQGLQSALQCGPGRQQLTLCATVLPKGILTREGLHLVPAWVMCILYIKPIEKCWQSLKLWFWWNFSSSSLSLILIISTLSSVDGGPPNRSLQRRCHV